MQTQPMTSTPSAELYKGFRDALRRIPEREGMWVSFLSTGSSYDTDDCIELHLLRCGTKPSVLQALWRGNGANVFRLVPEVGLRFLLNDQLETLFSPTDGSPPTLATHIAAGWQASALGLRPLNML